MVHQDILATPSAQQDNTHSIVKTKLVKSVSDKPRARQKLCIPSNNSLMSKWHAHNPDSHVRTNPKDTQFALENVVAANDSFLRIKMSISLIHFKPDFAASNVKHLNSEPSVTALEAPTTPAAQQAPMTPEQMCHLFECPSSPPGSHTDTQPDGGQRTRDAGGTITNPDNLPADICNRQPRGQQPCAMPTGEDCVPFRLIQLAMTNQLVIAWLARITSSTHLATFAAS